MASLNHPADLKYSKTDEWVRVQGDQATIGITDYAQDQLGDVVYVEIPLTPGQQIGRDQKFGDIESVKATSELVAPISGEVLQINELLKDHPELVNEQPYGDGWMLVVKLSNPAELDDLMTAEQYIAYLEGR
ncbi:glycine cleavage system H protein [Thermogemmatispora aurantia]|jgi:glycine cleavage system H protein|uniref:Glycine cleavage system H protein n=2 Tax=Thermogemmatispora TaxID=768669 RepID=A0A328VK27_9CHLR|nr:MULTISPECIES: glycine cleavage system protein GcvH [Thermogemmatispora]RAQ96522.1 glycine cleavage system protein H [Thermogemmatispora tikiterensis]GER85783.1 glycine cleavage system H protein [Thermogemmatispora aurantia]